MQTKYKQQQEGIRIDQSYYAYSGITIDRGMLGPLNGITIEGPITPGVYNRIGYNEFPPPPTAITNIQDASAVMNNPFGFQLNQPIYNPGTGLGGSAIYFSNLSESNKTFFTSYGTGYKQVYFGDGSSIEYCTVYVDPATTDIPNGIITMYLNCNPPGVGGTYGSVIDTSISYPATFNYPFVFIAPNQTSYEDMNVQAIAPHVRTGVLFPITNDNAIEDITATVNGEVGFTITTPYRIIGPIQILNTQVKLRLVNEWNIDFFKGNASKGIPSYGLGTHNMLLGSGSTTSGLVKINVKNIETAVNGETYVVFEVDPTFATFPFTMNYPFKFM